MLLHLMHEGPDGCLSARLQAVVVRRIQVRNPALVHDGLDDGRSSHARHARKGVDIDDPVVAFFCKLQNSGDAQTGFSCDIKCKNTFLVEQAF